MRSNSEKLDLILAQNDIVLSYLNRLLTMETEMTDTLDDAVHDIEALTTIEEGTAAVVDHAVSLLDEIGAKLAAAGQDPAKLAALRAAIAKNSTDLSVHKDALAEAVKRNTPFENSGN